MTPEYQFALELEFRRLEQRMMGDLTRIIDDNPDWSTRQRADALQAILEESYPVEFLEWLDGLLGRILP